jgi:beta-lactamase regulating signal transducer with metallopeptidase domain
MNELGRTLLWSTLQVTLLAAGVAAVYAVVSRRRPATAVQVTAAGLAGCAVLTVAGFCPLPGWWTWLGDGRSEPAAVPARPSGNVSDPAATRKAATPDEEARGGLSWPAAWLVKSLIHASGAASEQPGRAASGMAIFAAVFLAGGVLGLGRLLVGLWLVARYRHSGQPIDDPEIHGLVQSLRSALACRRVSLRECAGLTGPATVGWLRPVLLLPAGWREWDAEERRAVLAHELAHVRRGDFAARVAAGLGLALHFYNPLLHWLSARMRLQQELAADALAAPLAGGRTCYLQNLARLALKMDGHPPAWPAQAFLSSPGTLMRRVKMLRSKDGPNDRRPARGALTALVVAGVVAASAVRSPARESAPEPPSTAAAGSSGNELRVRGPGVWRIVQASADDPAPATGRDTKAPRKPAGELKAEELNLTCVSYDKNMYADNKKNKACFYENVRVLSFPCNDPTIKIDLDTMPESLPPGGVYLRCDELEVLSRPIKGGKSHQEMIAVGHVRVQSKDVSGRAAKVTFNGETGQIILEGGDDGYAVLYKQEEQGADPLKVLARRIIYIRKTGQYKTVGMGSLTGGN